MYNFFKISRRNKIEILHSIKWGMISLTYYFMIFCAIYTATKIFNLGKLRLRDRFDVSVDAWIKLLDIAIVAPILETFALLLLINLFNKYQKNKKINYIIITIIFGAFHLVSGKISLVLLIMLTFQIQLIYLFIRSSYTNFKIIWLEGAIIHSMNNSVLFALSYYKILH